MKTRLVRPKPRLAPLPRMRYAPGRLAAGIKIAMEHSAEMAQATATLPEQVQLASGLLLKQVRRGELRVDYQAKDGMTVLASYEWSPHGLLLHVSVSYRSRDPKWKELKMLRAAFFPDDVDVIQVLPRAGEFVNCHEHAFHLFQAPETWQAGWNV